MKVMLTLTGAAAAVTLTIAPAPAHADKLVCGWYAIIYCSDSEAAVNAANKGWGVVVSTNDYRGFAPNKFCLVSGPQSKSSALKDRASAIKNGYTREAYVKRACTESYNVGD